ncbi:MAG: hypothetical protein ABSA42_16875 [Terracidiphilus sp.]
MLSGSQQQMAGNKVDSMAHEAGELSQEERSQAARIDKLVHEAQQLSSSDPGTPDLDKLHSLMQERDALANERQQLSDELSKLQANMRNATRDLAANQPETAKKLHDALTEMDDTDLDNHVQGTADWLRSGINPNSNGTESEIAQGLSKLSQQLQQAQMEMAQERPGRGKGQGTGARPSGAAAQRVGSNGGPTGWTRRPARPKWIGSRHDRTAIPQWTAKPQRTARRRPATGRG